MLAIIIIVFIIAADQISKYLTVQYLKPLGSVPIINGVFSLSYVENRGAAFGIMQNQRWFFISLTIIICLAMGYYLFSHPREDLLRKISLAMIIGGAIGNLIDRIFLGYVVDMYHVTLINFAVFNTADSAVVVGTILLAYHLLFIDIKDEKV